LSERAAPFLLPCALATLLASTSLAGGRALDDWLLALLLDQRSHEVGLSRGQLDIFSFTTGSQEENRALMERGVMLPWWTTPDLKIAFLRPLAAITHLLDQRLWPEAAWLMHLQSLCWFALLLLAVRLLFRRLSGSVHLAWLATTLYALDDAHGATLSWIANRNALIAGTLVCATLVAHDMWRRDRKAWAGALAVVAFASSLASGEMSVGVLGYLLSYAVFREDRGSVSRGFSLAPYLVLTLAWRVGWSEAGYGVSGSGAYVDPGSDPWVFLRQAPEKWLLLLGGQFGILPADLAFLGPPSWRPLLLGVSTLTLLATGLLLAPCFSNREVRFWLGGMLLGLLPMAATFESDRSLLLVGLGASQILAHALLDAHGRHRNGGLSRLRAFTALGLAVIHLGLAPLLLPVRAAQMSAISKLEESAFQKLLAAPEASSKTVVLLNAPSPLLSGYAQLRLIQRRLTSPPALLTLASTPYEVQITRTAQNEVRVTIAEGFGATPLERHYRADFAGLGEGTEVQLSAFSARVERVSSDGRPQSVLFEFKKPLEDYLFGCWTGAEFVRCQVPALGSLEALSLMPDTTLLPSK